MMRADGVFSNAVYGLLFMGFHLLGVFGSFHLLGGVGQ